MDYIFSDRISGLKPSAIREILKYGSDPKMIAFSAGNPAPESFPVSEMKEISAEISTVFTKSAAESSMYAAMISSVTVSFENVDLSATMIQRIIKAAHRVKTII